MGHGLDGLPLMLMPLERCFPSAESFARVSVVIGECRGSAFCVGVLANRCRKFRNHFRGGPYVPVISRAGGEIAMRDGAKGCGFQVA